MSEPVSEELTVAELLDQVARLERRVVRERSARLEAERIAEDGLRELYLANSELDARILERTVQLDNALDLANVANRGKTAFLAHMSHHLLTPLNGVVGMLELLGDADFEDHQTSWHASALRSAHRIDRLVRQLLIFAEVDGADLTQGAPVHRLSDVMEGLEIQWHRPLLLAGQLPMFEVAGSHDRWISAPAELSLLFTELFSNVVEHASPGPVNVRVRMVAEDTIAIDVEDAGPGVDAEMQRMADSLGVSDDLEQRADQSTGLGLALMKRIAESIGGCIQIAQQTPTTISVELPLVQPRPNV